MKELRISAIRSGTVIDHLPVSSVFKIVKILGLKNSHNEISIATNLPSKKLGRKGLIKISDIFLEQTAIDAIALLAEGSSIVIIKNYKIAKKQVVKIPRTIIGIVRCFNPNCITNHEASTTRFAVIDKKPLRLQCYYCEKITTEQALKFN